jgi:hypothetical protein
MIIEVSCLGVTPLFGDKDGLLDVLAEQGFETCLGRR